MEREGEVKGVMIIGKFTKPELLASPACVESKLALRFPKNRPNATVNRSNCSYLTYMAQWKFLRIKGVSISPPLSTLRPVILEL